MINKRLFGQDIPIKVKKKLEARQLLAAEARPGESIDSRYKDASLGAADHPYSDWINSDSNFSADLSSRTPFTRMWVAISLSDIERVKDTLAGPFDPNDETEIEEEIKKKGAAYDKATAELSTMLDAGNPGAEVVEIDGKYYVKGREKVTGTDIATRIYSIGDNNLKEYTDAWANTMGATMGLMQTSDEGMLVDYGYGAGGTILNSLPDEMGTNSYNKPRAGIVSVSSETQGMLGVLKKTKVSFEVHNFQDFDQIYNRFFLKPGATVFVDFGWSTLKGKLYNPKDLINAPDIKEFLYGEPSKDKENNEVVGEVTKNQGDLEVLQGIVTNHEAKILENGSVQCSIELTSANSALLGFQLDSHTVRKIQNTMDYGILYLAIHPMILHDYDFHMKLSNKGQETLDSPTEFQSNTTGYDPSAAQRTDTAKKKLESIQEHLENKYDKIVNVPDFNSSTDEQIEFNDTLLTLAVNTLGAHYLIPAGNAIRTGVFVGDVKGNDSYVNWGFFEDIIINAQFGFGEDITNINSGKNLQIRLDSKNSFTAFSPIFYERQRTLSDSGENKPVFLIPEWWGGADGMITHIKEVIDAKEKQEKIMTEFHELYTRAVKTKFLGEMREKEGVEWWVDFYFYHGGPSDTVGGFTDFAVTREEELIEQNQADDYGFKGSYNFQNVKTPYDYTEAESKEMQVSNHEKYKKQMEEDISLNRVPLREVFIKVETIIDAFSKGKDVKDALNRILKKVNTDMDYGMRWELITGETDSELMVVDTNYLDIQTKIDKSGEEGEEGEEVNIAFDKLFKFDIMSANSIVKNYDISLNLGSGAIGNMYAIQAMNHENVIFPIDNQIEKALALSALDPESLAITYQPNNSAYRAAQLDAQLNMDSHTTSIYQNAQELLSDNVYNIGAGQSTYLTAVNPDDHYEDPSNLPPEDSKESEAYHNPEPDTTEKIGIYTLETFQDKQAEQLTEKSEGEDTKEAVQKYLEQEKIRAETLGYKVCAKLDDYYSTLVKKEILIDKTPTLLPIKLNLSTYGIASLTPGDVFRVSYLPSIYQDRVYFQIMRISHDIGPGGWTTNLETQFRIRPDKKQITYTTVDANRIILSPSILDQFNLQDGKKIEINNIENSQNNTFKCGYTLDIWQKASEEGSWTNDKNTNIKFPKDQNQAYTIPEIQRRMRNIRIVNHGQHFKHINLILEFEWNFPWYEGKLTRDRMIRFPWKQEAWQYHGYMGSQNYSHKRVYPSRNGKSNSDDGETGFYPEWLTYTGYGHQYIGEGNYDAEYKGEDNINQLNKTVVYRHMWHCEMNHGRKYYMIINGSNWAIVDKEGWRNWSTHKKFNKTRNEYGNYVYQGHYYTPDYLGVRGTQAQWIDEIIGTDDPNNAAYNPVFGHMPGCRSHDRQYVNFWNYDFDLSVPRYSLSHNPDVNRCLHSQGIPYGDWRYVNRRMCSTNSEDYWLPANYGGDDWPGGSKFQDWAGYKWMDETLDAGHDLGCNGLSEEACADTSGCIWLAGACYVDEAAPIFGCMDSLADNYVPEATANCEEGYNQTLVDPDCECTYS